MSFYDDVIFPTSISLRAFHGKRMRQTDVVQNQAGFEQRNAVWTQTRRTYDAGLVARPASEWQMVDALFEVANGQANGFLLQDPVDYGCLQSEGLLQPLDATGLTIGGTGFGYGLPTYQLTKRYRSGSRAADRKIAKPQSGLATIYRNGGAVTAGLAAGNVAIDFTTGMVTFVADGASTVTGVTVGATTQVTLTAAIAGLAVNGRLYLSGLTGADAALLNNLSQPITAIAGAVYTLATDTTGKTITAAGSGYKYPQPTDALAWAGQFYVPVRFATDELDWQTIDKLASGELLIEGPSVPIIEIRI